MKGRNHKRVPGEPGNSIEKAMRDSKYGVGGVSTLQLVRTLLAQQIMKNEKELRDENQSDYHYRKR